MVWAIWARPKIQLHLVPLQNILCLHKNCTYQMEIIFWSGTKSLTSPKYFGTSRKTRQVLVFYEAHKNWKKSPSFVKCVWSS